MIREEFEENGGSRSRRSSDDEWRSDWLLGDQGIFVSCMISYGLAPLITVSLPATPDDLHIHLIDVKARNFWSGFWDF